MKYQKFLYFIQNVGKDPSALIFEDYLTGLNNRRFLLHYLKHNIEWNDLEEHPVSLLVVDIDYFKRINDEYGHTIGDQVLIHIAGILKTINREKGVPSLYAGDIFMLLLPGIPKRDAVKAAAELFYQVNNNLFFSADAGTEIPITISIGLASAPDDATSGEDLVSQAQNALFHAKQAGRNRYADASLVSRQAVHYLENAGIVGRKAQFDLVSAALKKFAEGQSQIVLVDGTPGMGKTSFLYTVQRNLEKTKLNIIQITGVANESFRPYYLVSNIVIKLLNQREDKGVDILESMDDKEVELLSQIIPQLTTTPLPMPQDEVEFRDLIFKSFARFFMTLVGNHPLAILIDDMHYSDPASLHLIRLIIQSKTVRLFICGTTSEEKQSKSAALPLDLFRSAYSSELGIQSITLNPLEVEHIDRFLNMAFPGIDMPSRLTRELADLTQGNPLFVTEILRKMISDQRIVQSGRQWKMTRLEKRYFPRSLEEIFKLKMDSLDDESKRFLECAAAFGDSISLSMLTGSYNEKSSKIHDFVNRGVAQGIVQSDFGEDDENIRFSSKGIREAIYERIESDQKKNLHEEIGNYHEKLYKQDLLPSASNLAYHFKRSGDQKKALTYSQLQEEHDRKIFSNKEAIKYIPEEDAESEDTLKAGAQELGDVALSEKGLQYAAKLFRALLISIRNIRLYPIDSKSVVTAIEQLKVLIDNILKDVERFSIITEKQNILINGHQIETKEYQPIAEKVVEFWDHLQIKSLTFVRGLEDTELKSVLETFSRLEQKEISPNFWKKYVEEQKLTRIFPRQVKYTKLQKSTDVQPEETGKEENEEETSINVMDLINNQEQHLDETGLKVIQKVVSSLLGAYSKLKLYPDNNPVATEAINQLMAELKQYFNIQSVLTIARVDRSLLVNGVKVDTTGFETLAKGLRRFFHDTKLNSITFLKQAGFKDLLEFIQSSIQVPAGETDSPFWPNKVKEKQINGILLNQQIYEVIDERAGVAVSEPDADEEHKAEIEKPIDDDDLEKLPERLRELFLTGDVAGVRAIVDQVCEKYKTSDESGKKQITEIFNAILQPQDWRPTAEFIKLVLNPVIPVFTQETNADISHQAAVLVHQCAAAFILFGEYALATWVYGCLKNFAAELDAQKKDPKGDTIIPDKSVDTKIFATVIEDLRDSDKDRQQEAYQLLSSMGQMVVPQLIDMIKREDNIRARQLAAELVKNSGQTGTDLLKKTLMGENKPDERARILDVIDSVTKDVMAELTDTLSDNRDIVRRAAFRLAERLSTPEVISMLIEFTRSSDTSLSVYAINSVTKLKPAAAKETIFQVLGKSDSAEVLIAACRALGQINDQSCIPPLTKILSQRKFLGSRKYDAQVRVAAASALSQIPGDQAQKSLAAAAKDPDYRVKETVKQALAKK